MAECAWCGEALEQEGNNPLHRECFTRMIVGGVNHLKRRCMCYGGIDLPDPEGTTKRQAAALAWAFWSLNQPKPPCD